MASPWRNEATSITGNKSSLKGNTNLLFPASFFAIYTFLVRYITTGMNMQVFGYKYQ